MRNPTVADDNLTRSVSVRGSAAAALPIHAGPRLIDASGDGWASVLPKRVLVLTANRELALTIVHALADDHVRVDLATTVAQARTHLRSVGYHAAIVDLQLPVRTGLKVAPLLRLAGPACACLVLTVPRAVAAALSAIKDGATDFLLKPVQPALLRQKAFGLLHASPPVLTSGVPAQVRNEHGLAGLLGITPIMQSLFAELLLAAGQSAPVLITGEPGTGKDLVARAVHELSPRRGPLLRVSAAALAAPELMLQLFGQERLATDGREVSAPGLIEQVQGGTLLVEELADLDASGQRCLRQLILGEPYSRRGSGHPRHAEVRVMAMSSRPLLELVRRGQLCADLFYRLSPVWLDVPPLRQRRDDIPLLAAEFLRCLARHHTHGPFELPGATLLQLKGHSWPGNVAELRALLSQAVLQLGSRSLEPEVIERLLTRTRPGPEARFKPGTTLAAVEREMILMTLAAVDGNKQRAAELLGLSRGALYGRLRTYEAQARAQWQAAQQPHR